MKIIFLSFDLNFAQGLEPPPLGATTAPLGGSASASPGRVSALVNSAEQSRNVHMSNSTGAQTKRPHPGTTANVQVIGLDHRISKDMLLGHFWTYGQVNDVVIDGTSATIMFSNSDALAKCITSGASNIAGFDFSELQVAVKSSEPSNKKRKM